MRANFVKPQSPSSNITVGFPHKVDATLIRNVTYECDVVFELKHSYFNRQHEAIDALPNHVIQRVFPNERTRSCNQYQHIIVPRCVLELDKSGQMQALEGILQQGPDPVIIAGPFGTGKTRVLARAAYELIMQNKTSVILICTHHQHSADTFIDYFQMLQNENHQFQRTKIVRIETIDYKSQIKTDYPWYYCGVKKASSCAPQIIVSTLGVSHYLKIKNISHIFIDEAAQTRETEAIIPLQHAGPGTKIVLAGDHCQVIYTEVI